MKTIDRNIDNLMKNLGVTNEKNYLKIWLSPERLFLPL